MSTLTDRCKIVVSVATPVYGPGMTVISAITNATLAAVTTTTNHGYVDGTIVRFDVTPACGMAQIDQMTSPIVVIGNTTFTTEIDSTLFAAFAIPASPDVHTNICSLCVPIGSENDTLEPAVRNIL